MAEFNWYLNRQGPRGRQGIQGEQGFSPVITVETNSLNAYILRIRTQDDTFLTPNLRGSVEDLGGTYVRYNRETGGMYAGSADLADTTSAGIIRIAAEQDLTELSQDAAVTPKQLMENIQSTKNELQTDIDNSAKLIDTYYKELTDSDTAIKADITKINSTIDQLNVMDGQNVKLTGDQTIEGTKTFTAIKISEINNKSGSANIIVEDGRTTFKSDVFVNDELYLKGSPAVRQNQFGDGLNWVDNKVTLNKATTESLGGVKPDGNTITITEDGIISSIVSGDVTLAGDNRFTGNNSFIGDCKFYNDTWIDFLKVGTSLVSQQGLILPPVAKVNRGALIRPRKNYNGLEIYEYNSDGTTGPEIGTLTSTVVDFAGTIKGSQGYLFGENNLVAGNNITFTKVNGVTTISSTASGGGGATINDETISTTTVYSSDKTVSFTTELISETMATLNETINQLTTQVSQLQTRVKTLEDLIDGGNA